MKKNRSRVFMTILATAIGCCFLIVLASVGFGLQKSLTDEVTSRGKLTQISVAKDSQEGDGPYGMTKEDTDLFEKIEHVNAVTKRTYPDAITSSLLSGKTLLENATPILVDMKAEENSRLELSAGTFPKAENEIIIGYNLVKDMAVKPIGETVTVTFEKQQDGENKANVKKELQLKIVGITKEPAKEWEQDSLLYIDDRNISKINETLLQPMDEMVYQNVTVFADDLKHVAKVTKAIKAKNYMAYSVASELKQIDSIFLVIKIGLIFVGAIAVLIAAIGIFNTMTMAVTERTQDIGIMKAIGATPKTIKSIFLIESTYIGAMGTLIGVIAAYLISLGVNFAVPMIINGQIDGDSSSFTFSQIPPSLLLIAALISIGVAILSGMKPARRATEIDVLKALRRDI
jgi:acetoin utilization transport system permease protein